MKGYKETAPDNRAILDWLFETGQIDLERGALFDQVLGPQRPDLDLKRLEGMLLGVAIGDGLGNTTESTPPAERQAMYGEIRDYLPNHHANGRCVGLPSDDTQLTFWTLEQLLEDNGLVPEHLAARFCRERIFGIGRTVAQFIDNYRSGLAWYQCGVRSAGNGALMRIAPVLVPHLRRGTPGLWADVAVAAMLTHNDAGSIAACLAFVYVLWQLLQMDTAPPPEWWLDTYVDTAQHLEGEKNYEPRRATVPPYRGPMWRYVQKHVWHAHRARIPVRQACEEWGSGAYLMETLPSVLYILMRHADDPEQPIIRAVNDTWDNDTIAAIVGAAVGALHGVNGLPDRWVAGLSGRTRADDDGYIYQLVEQAKQHFWERTH